MSEQFEKMTVLELRKAAKEMGVKLGAGISKQGIIDKLNEAAAGKQPEEEANVSSAAAPLEAPSRPIRSAAIITDDESDDDDIPVLTPNTGMRPSPRPAAPAAPAAQPAASSLGTISSKAPAFTMEGSRAWHNPRAYQGQNNSYQRAPQAWGAPRPAQATPSADRGAYAPRTAPQPQRPDMRPAMPQTRPAAYSPNRFGPEQPMQQEERPVDYRPAPSFNQPQQDYSAPRENTAYSQSAAYSRPAQAPYYHKEPPAAPSIPEILAAGECGDGEGVLELHPDGYGFLRADHYLAGKNDVYVANAQIRRFNLRSGDYIVGKTRPQRENDRYSALLYITEINGHAAEENPNRPSFEEMTAIYPKRSMSLAAKNEECLSLRLADLLSPIGFGQRALITLPPKASKKALMQKLANNISKNYSKAHVMLMLVDEKPEEVTAMKESVKGEVVYSTFDDLPENQGKICELALERALRLVEQKKDVVILLDSLNALVRAHHVAAPQNVRTLSGGLAATALNKPKRLLAAARNTREGGTLTVLCFAQSTGFLSDEGLMDEFKSACNAHWILTLPADAQGLPGIDFIRSVTQHDELMLSAESLSVAQKMRGMLADDDAAQDTLFALAEKTQSNAELVEKFDIWMEMLRG
ncbi:MAG: transcription termination factor Rho [Clostridiales bacterium]|nr:transcription termination factor Rho [Clostridiales bacterium]